MPQSSTLEPVFTFGPPRSNSPPSVPFFGIPSQPKSNRTLSKQHEKYYFADGSTVIKIDGVLFNLHRCILERYSPKFSSLLLGPHVALNPLVLQDVNITDFERFLSVLYPAELYVEPVRSSEEWISILKQAHHWQVDSLKREAAQRVASVDLKPAQRIKLYQQCGLEHSADLLTAFMDLCRREETISLSEATLLGLETYNKVVSLREIVIKGQVEGQLTDEVTKAFSLKGLDNPDPLPSTAATSTPKIGPVKVKVKLPSVDRSLD
ncbi:hypothetical protein ONZ45_g5136 [Pleurotus djamor]|nr:hypothetical protein ONZ45_g5136 [Pleurotus djamor]